MPPNMNLIKLLLITTATITTALITTINITIPQVPPIPHDHHHHHHNATNVTTTIITRSALVMFMMCGKGGCEAWIPPQNIQLNQSLLIATKTLTAAITTTTMTQSQLLPNHYHHHHHNPTNTTTTPSLRTNKKYSTPTTNTFTTLTTAISTITEICRRVVCGGCVCLLVFGVGVDVVVGMVVVVTVGY